MDSSFFLMKKYFESVESAPKQQGKTAVFLKNDKEIKYELKKVQLLAEFEIIVFNRSILANFTMPTDINFNIFDLFIFFGIIEKSEIKRFSLFFDTNGLNLMKDEKTLYIIKPIQSKKDCKILFAGEKAIDSVKKDASL